jgi:tetratricopeptide (TPR) repeat protein
MSKTLPIKLLGEVLQEAGLISAAQIEIALQDQAQSKNLKIGEILAFRGWIKQETADFFAEQWPMLLRQKSKQSLGYYLKEAGLLDELQIKTILYEQKWRKLRFGELVVLKGWLNPTTIDFFLAHLASESDTYQRILQEEVSVDDSQVQTKLLNLGSVAQQQDKLQMSNGTSQSDFHQSKVEQELARVRLFNRSTIKLFKLEKKATRPDILLEEVLSWTGAHQPILTQKVCQLLSESEAFIPAGEEARRVEYLVRTRVINHWETQVASEHLKAIRDGLLKNQHCDPLLLLMLYQQILQQGEVPVDNTPAQTELLHLGLVVQQYNKLKVANRIYQSVFHHSWVEQELARVRLFNQSTIKLFKLEKKATRPDILLEEVLSWTGVYQPILTQKICQLLSESETFIPAGEEARRVEYLVRTRVVEHWETQIASEHLKAIRDGLLNNQHCDPLLLLMLYQQILQQGELPVDNTLAQAELLNLGLVIQQHDKLKVANRIYQSVFHLSWVEQELSQTRFFRHNTIKLFKLEKKATRPDILLEEVLSWTGAHQPILTQKVCQLLSESETFIPAGEEARRVEYLVQTRVIEHWETQIASEHLRAIRDGLLNNQHCDPLLLLMLYQQILQQGEVPVDDTLAQTELLNLGLVVQQYDKLKVANCIYQSVFHLSWVEYELEQSLQSSPSITTGLQDKLDIENTLTKTKKTIFNLNNLAFRYIWIVLGIISCFTVALLIGFNMFKRMEVKILFEQSNDLLHKGKYQQALAIYNKILNIDSNYYEAWTNRGYAFAGIQQYNQMLESCSAANIIEPRAVYSWNCQGEALHNLKQYDKAIAAFDKAITLNSKDHVFWINKTESLLALKQPDKALAAIDRAIELLGKIKEVDQQETINRSLSVAFSHKGQAFSQQQKYEEALEAYNQALTYDPHYFAGQRGRGLMLQNLQRYNQAISQFNKTLNESNLTNAQKTETLYNLGLALCHTSNINQGRSTLEEAFKLKPDEEALQEARKNCR